MTKLWGMFSDLYSNNPDVCHCQFTNLTLSTFCNPDAPHTTYPKLKGKGAEIKDLVFALNHIWSRLAPTGDSMYPLVGKALAHLVAAQEILRDHCNELFLPPKHVKSFQYNTQEFLLSY